MLKRSNVERPNRLPQAREFRDAPNLLRLKSPNPEPRFPDKHALNPPIVTIFGAGVAGLTAAHELVERGFLVQVVEEAEDPYASGRPLVGGMAANQGARVRANIEDLHSDTIVRLAQGRGPKQPPTVSPKGEVLHKASVPPKDLRIKPVAQFLLGLFAANRTLWIQSEKPVRIHQTIWSLPTNKRNALANSRPFKEVLFEDLHKAKAAYRERWLWDLIVRLTLLGDISPRPNGALAGGVSAAAAAQQPVKDDTLRDDAKKLAFAQGLLSKVKDVVDPVEIVALIFEALDKNKLGFPNLEGTDIRALKGIVGPAMEREFLAFELVPFYRSGIEGSEAKARQLVEAWAEVFEGKGKNKVTAFKDNCLVSVAEATLLQLRAADAPPFLPDNVKAWVELRVLEIRLPGEHGYRFFPSFYRHLDETMSRIPLFHGEHPSGRTVLDNLLPTVRQGLGFDLDKDEVKEDWDPCDKRQPGKEADYPKVVWPPEKAKRPLVLEFHRGPARSIEGLRDRTDRFITQLGGTPGDAARFFARLLKFMTSSPERRELYEKESWDSFIKIEDFSPPMRAQIEAAAQVLLAFSTGVADARTYGDTVTQLFLDQFREGAKVDRTLNGPTSDAWLEPWREYLERQGVRFFWGRLEKLELKKMPDTGKEELVPVLVDPSDNQREQRTLWSQAGHKLLTSDSENPGDRPDFYILALDLPRAAHLTRDLAKLPSCGEFARLKTFKAEVDREKALTDMTGIQLFFDAKTSIGRGHMYFPLAPWGLSSISQSEFWSRRCGFADGFMGVLSVDVAETDRARNNVPSFKDTLADGIDRAKAMSQSAQTTYARWLVGRGVWNELNTRIDKKVDKLSQPRCFHVDENLYFGDEKDLLPDPSDLKAEALVPKWRNRTKYLAAQKEHWVHRPGLRRLDPNKPKPPPGEEIGYELNHERWVLCGTYNATYTRMTTMEAANESARHAVRAILKRLQVDDASGKDNVTGAKDNLAFEIYLGRNNTFNGASTRRIYDDPDVWNPEEQEFPDLELLKRVDARLVAEGVPHFMDVCDFDAKLELAIEASRVFGNADQANNLLSLSLAGLRETVDQSLTDSGRKASEVEPHLKKTMDILVKAFEDSPFKAELEAARAKARDFMTKK